MTTTGLFAGNVNLLERSLDLRSARHELILNNIANMDTPGYKAFDLVLGQEMAAEAGAPGADAVLPLRRTDPGHMPTPPDRRETIPASVEPSPATAPNLRGDGNTVEIDREMVHLSENALVYSALSQVISREFALMKAAIQERIS